MSLTHTTPSSDLPSLPQSETTRIRLFKELHTSQDVESSLLNWAKTRALARRDQLHCPSSISQVQHLVQTYRHIRPIGSCLTYEALTCVSNDTSDSILIDLSQLHGLVSMNDDNTATFYAGTTIDQVSCILEKYGRYINCSPGVIGVQTLAGAIGTGTHGQGLDQSFMCDIVTQMEVVRADGSLMIINDQQNSDLLDAFRIHLGLLGLIVKVTLQTQPSRILTCTKATITLNDFVQSFIDLNHREKYCKAWWFTNTGLVHVWAASPASQKEIRLFHINQNQLTPVEVAGDEDRLASTIYQLEQKMAQDTCDTNHLGRQFETIHRFKRAVSVTGTMQQIYMKGIPVPQINCEIAVPLTEFSNAVRALMNWTQTTHHKLHYPFIFRCTGASRAWLAPHRGQQLCYIGFLVYLAKDGTATPGSLEMMRDIQTVLAPLGGIPHWGKHMALDTYASLTQLYPRFIDFCRVMLAEDPTGKWHNQFTRQLLAPAIQQLHLEEGSTQSFVTTTTTTTTIKPNKITTISPSNPVIDEIDPSIHLNRSIDMRPRL